jgi:hypothetical protein
MRNYKPFLRITKDHQKANRSLRGRKSQRWRCSMNFDNTSNIL